MLGVRSRALALLVAVAALLGAPAAGAQSKVSRLAGKLANAEDFRVRTQAALALGASKDGDAVKPLCGGLDDSNATVRAAAAAALGKLKKGGSECLRKRLDDESSASVKSTIRRSLKKLEGVSEDAESLGKLGSSTKYYVAIDDTNDKTKRDVDSLVRAAMIRALREEGGLVVAPRGESAATAKKALKAHSRVNGFFLMPKVRKPKYKNGSLTIRVQVTVFNYPDKAMKGMIPVKFTQEGTSSKDEKAEDELIQMGVESAVKKFLKNIGRFQ